MKSKLTLNLPPHLHHWAEAQASANGYDTVSEYIQHMLMEKRQTAVKGQIERRLLQAIEQNEYFDLTEAHFIQLDKKLQTLAKSKSKKRDPIKQ